MTGLTLSFTPESHIRIQKMRDHCHTIANHYGVDSPEHRAAKDSLLTSLVTMIGLAGNIMTESGSELSLFCVNEFIAYGVNFSGSRVEGDPKGTWSVNS